MAQSFGSSIRSRKSGTFGDISATSFFPTKPLGCYGDGGAIFTDSDELADLARSIRVHGGGKNKYDNVRLGINGRLDTIQACVLLEKLEIFDGELKKRKELSNFYNENISSTFKKQYHPLEYDSAHALYTVLARSKSHKDQVLISLSKKNIPFGLYYEKPLHLQEVFKEASIQKIDRVLDISSRVFSIPIHPYITDEEKIEIVEVLNDS
jgi:dTDP-4-amino-4,6-dideoxygalactose transaminase